MEYVRELLASVGSRGRVVVVVAALLVGLAVLWLLLAYGVDVVGLLGAI